MREISDEKLSKYLSLTEEALKRVKIKVSKNSKEHRIAEDFLDMATRYYKDAKHYKEKGDFVTAFAAVNYAHAWLDAGARAEFFDVDKESGLFTVD